MRVLGSILSRQVAGYVSRLGRLNTLACFLSFSPRQGVLATHYGPIWWHTQTDSGLLRAHWHVLTNWTG